MARLIVVFALALGLMGAAFASAATLIVDGGVIQAGSDNSLTCDADGVDLDWMTNTQGDGTATVTGVIVKGAEGCANQKVLVHLYKSVSPSGSNWLGMVRGTFGADGTAQAIEFYGASGWAAGSVSASDVNAATVIIKDAFTE